jgi:hypothetical protein
MIRKQAEDERLHGHYRRETEAIVVQEISAARRGAAAMTAAAPFCQSRTTR